MIYTFYSYKGGVGRSMAMANIAEYFYRKGLRVVAIDWDLEAPGLESFFYNQQDESESARVKLIRSQLGLIDMLLAYRRQYASLSRLRSKSGSAASTDGAEPEEALREAPREKPTMAKQIEFLQENLPPLKPYLYPIHDEGSLSSHPEAALWLLPAGWRSGERFSLYSEAVQNFNWTDFYERFDGKAYFEWMRYELEKAADIILIDSRTGVTEMGGVCTRQLADVVVGLAVLNNQNIDGLAKMVKSFKRSEVIQARDGRPLQVVAVPTRIDTAEIAARNMLTEEFLSKMGDVPPIFERCKRTFWDLRIPYISYYAYAEKLAVSATDGAEELRQAYQEIAEHLALIASESSPVQAAFAREIERKFGLELPRVFFCADNQESSVALRNQMIQAGVRLWHDSPSTATEASAARQAAYAFNSVESLVMLVNDETLASPDTRQTWRAARQRGICVYPVKTTGAPLESPQWLSKVRIYDAEQELNELIERLKSPCFALRAPFMAPDLPEGHVGRPAELTGLKSLLLNDNGESRGGLKIALCGAAGTGKTALVTALCQDDAIDAAYSGGIFWVTLGTSPNGLAELTKLYAALTGETRSFTDEEEAARLVAEKMGDRDCLMVIDDVWDATALRPFVKGGRRCARLITTRNRSLEFDKDGTFIVDEMTDTQALDLLAAQARLPRESLTELVSRFGQSPLSLKLAGNALRKELELGVVPQEALRFAYNAFASRGITAFDQQGTADRTQSVSTSMDATLRQLKSPDELERFCRLRSLPADQPITVARAAKLWKLDEFETEAQLKQFHSLSLLDFNPEEKVYHPHPLVQAYLSRALPEWIEAELKAQSSAHSKGWLADHHINNKLAIVGLIVVLIVGALLVPLVRQAIFGKTNKENSDSQTAAAAAFNLGNEFLAKPAPTTQDLTEALVHYSRAIDLQPNNASYYLARAGVLLRQEKGDDALSDFNKAVEIDNNALNSHPEAYLVRGSVYLNKGAYDRAIDDYSKAITIKPDYADAYYARGNVYLNKELYDLAIADYKQAIIIKPDYVLAHKGLGDALYKLANYAEAEAQYRWVTSVEPNSDEGFNNLGKMLYEQGKYAEAEAAYKTALSLNPKNTEAHKGQGDILYYQGKQIEAEKEYRTAIAIDPTDAAAHLGLAYALGEQSKYAQAQVEYKTAINRNPNYAKEGIVLYNLGVALVLTQKYAEAEAILRNALTVDNYAHDPQVHYYLGIALENQKKYTEAEAHYKEASSQNFDKATEKLKQLLDKMNNN